MKIDDPKILKLRALVKAATEEFESAIAYHEAWKPAAHDSELHKRIGTSFAANTFFVVRIALRREMLMALMRIWDTNRQTIQMEFIVKALADEKVVDALAAESEAHWHGLEIPELTDIPTEQRDEWIEAIHRKESDFGRQQSDALRQNARDAIEIFGAHSRGGPHYSTLNKLRKLRHERLAHRHIAATSEEIARADPTYEQIETVYQNTLKLMRLLRLSVENVDWDPSNTAEIRRRHSELFWASVRGERTEGHPNYHSRQKLESRSRRHRGAPAGSGGRMRR
jgi:hypothetical protein